jgi:uncharacterized protein
LGLIYVDTCTVIYLVEESPRYFNLIQQAIEKEEGSSFAISSLVKAECLVGPFRSGNARLQSRYETYFTSVLTLDIDESIFLKAAALRAHNGLKMADALHLACAQSHQCDAFWTNDLRLSSAGSPMKIVVI